MQLHPFLSRFLFLLRPVPHRVPSIRRTARGMADAPTEKLRRARHADLPDDLQGHMGEANKAYVRQDYAEAIRLCEYAPSLHVVLLPLLFVY